MTTKGQERGKSEMHLRRAQIAASGILDLLVRRATIGSRFVMPKNSATRKKLTPQEQRNLDIEIAFVEGIVRRDPQFVDALQILGDDYTRRGRFVEGLQVDRKLVSLRPSDPLVHYNLACSCSLTGQLDVAATELEQAITLGYRDFRWLSRDPDLRNLRQHPLFKGIRARLAAFKNNGQSAP